MHLSSAGCNIILIEAVRGLDVVDTLCRMGADAICLRLLFAACAVVEVLFVGVVCFLRLMFAACAVEEVLFVGVVCFHSDCLVLCC